MTTPTLFQETTTRDIPTMWATDRSNFGTRRTRLGASRPRRHREPPINSGKDPHGLMCRADSRPARHLCPRCQNGDLKRSMMEEVCRPNEWLRGPPTPVHKSFAAPSLPLLPRSRPNDRRPSREIERRRLLVSGHLLARYVTPPPTYFRAFSVRCGCCSCHHPCFPAKRAS